MQPAVNCKGTNCEFITELVIAPFIFFFFGQYNIDILPEQVVFLKKHSIEVLSIRIMPNWNFCSPVSALDYIFSLQMPLFIQNLLCLKYKYMTG